MSLVFLDKQMKPFNGNPFRSFHDGYSGDVFEDKVYIRNLDKTRYYTEISIEPKFKNSYQKDSGELGNTGWSIKLMYGERRPTEEEWAAVPPASVISIPDIGSESKADTIRKHPVWLRIFCPGNSPAQIKKNIFIELEYYEKVVNV